MEQREIIDVGSRDIGVMRDPNMVLAEAKKAAVALMEVVKQKTKPVIMNGEQYLEFEDWQILGQFYGLSAKVVSTTFIDLGGVKGYEARAELIRNSDGMALSSADAMCLNDEDKWSTRTKYEDCLDDKGKKIWVEGTGGKKGHYKKEKVGDVPVPLFQLRSMAQTRACAKALRNKLAWVAVLAGFKPTTAEELTGDEESHLSPSTKPHAEMPKEIAYSDIITLAQSKVGDTLNVQGYLISSVQSTTKAPSTYVIGDLPKEPTTQIPIKSFSEFVTGEVGKIMKFNEVKVTDYQGKNQATAKEVLIG